MYMYVCTTEVVSSRCAAGGRYGTFAADGCSAWNLEETKRNITITISIHQYADILRSYARNVHLHRAASPIAPAGTFLVLSRMYICMYRHTRSRPPHASDGGAIYRSGNARVGIPGHKPPEIPMDYPAEKETLLSMYSVRTVNMYFEFGRFIVSARNGILRGIPGT